MPYTKEDIQQTEIRLGILFNTEFKFSGFINSAKGIMLKFDPKDKNYLPIAISKTEFHIISTTIEPLRELALKDLENGKCLSEQQTEIIKESYPDTWKNIIE